MADDGVGASKETLAADLDPARTGSRPRSAEPQSTAGASETVGRVLLGKWRLESVVGTGGMGTVYSARHRNGAMVAIKMLHRRLASEKAIRRRFCREAYLANAVDHPWVVTIHDDGVDEDGTPFFVMDLLRGQTVEQLRLAAPEGRLDIDFVQWMAMRLLQVLQVAHEKGITHRDIKPSNLFVCNEGELRVLDFGVAASSLPLPGDSSVGTTIDALLGTPSFMPPEQARACWAEVDARSDIWAVGATMFRLLTGRFVHIAKTPNEQLGMAMSVPAPSLASGSRDVPRRLVEIVDRALQFDRGKRFQSAKEMLAALSNCPAIRVDPARDTTPTPVGLTQFGLGSEDGSLQVSALGPPALAAPPSSRARIAPSGLNGKPKSVLATAGIGGRPAIVGLSLAAVVAAAGWPLWKPAPELRQHAWSVMSADPVLRSSAETVSAPTPASPGPGGMLEPPVGGSAPAASCSPEAPATTGEPSAKRETSPSARPARARPPRAGRPVERSWSGPGASEQNPFDQRL